MNVKHTPRKFKVKVGDLVADARVPSNVGFISKIENSNVLFHCIHGKNAGKIYTTHKNWLIHIDDIIFEED